MTPHNDRDSEPTGTLSLEDLLAAGNAEISARRGADDLIRSGRALLDYLRMHRDQVAADLAGVDSLLALVGTHLAGLEYMLNRSEAPHLMGVTRASKYLGVSRNTLYKMIHTGEITAVESRDAFARLGVLKSELDSFMANRPQRPPRDSVAVPKRINTRSGPMDGQM